MSIRGLDPDTPLNELDEALDGVSTGIGARGSHGKDQLRVRGETVPKDTDYSDREINLEDGVTRATREAGVPTVDGEQLDYESPAPGSDDEVYGQSGSVEATSSGSFFDSILAEVGEVDDEELERQRRRYTSFT